MDNPEEIKYLEEKDDVDDKKLPKERRKCSK